MRSQGRDHRFELHGPQAGVPVGEEDVPLVGLRPPGHRRVGHEALRVVRQEPRDLAALAVEIAHQIAGDVDRAQAGVVVGDVHHAVLDPEVVRAGLRDLVARGLHRILEVREVEEVDPAARTRRLARHVEAVGEGLVTGGHVEAAGVGLAVGERRVVPAARIGVARDLHRVLGRCRRGCRCRRRRCAPRPTSWTSRRARRRPTRRGSRDRRSEDLVGADLAGARGSEMSMAS